MLSRSAASRLGFKIGPSKSTDESFLEAVDCVCTTPVPSLSSGWRGCSWRRSGCRCRGWCRRRSGGRRRGRGWRRRSGCSWRESRLGRCSRCSPRESWCSGRGAGGGLLILQVPFVNFLFAFLDVLYGLLALVHTFLDVLNALNAFLHSIH